MSLNVEGRIDDFDFRIVKIEGEKEDVLKGITQVMKTVKEMQGRINENSQDKTTAKFVFPEKTMGFMIGKKGYFIQELNSSQNV